ncbi:sugar ABC transporter substrate-binding protein [Clostridium sp. YIM B02515]|uniref:Sugar ABC transporter substrate-binding protein n=1 Tax=Clostridium rhizosphaerae TaxID=2803861 RepID=A0ABS1TGU5_9CLOT|nr:sugar ABC transporter substrate-binding protein [Clostridium rhizosphaerae]MBL4938623.1 sugar ABC transporter substrate-binding protein [Clostridium rhizosphaerae]
MKKRHLVALLACIFITSTLIGCKKDTVSTNSEWKTKGTNEYGWAIPEKTVEINFYAKGKYDPEKSKTRTEPLEKYVLDNFNVKLNKIVYNQDGDERFNLSLASNDYPEVITGLSKGDVEKLKEQGKIKDLTPYIDKYGESIKKELGDLYSRYKDKDGKVYALPFGWGMLPIPDYSAHIRWDWYQEIGAPKFETPEEYYDVLKKIVEKHPTNSKGQKVYALSWDNDNCFISTANASSTGSVPAAAGIWGLKEGYKEDSSHNLTHWVNTQEGLDFTKFYNKAYRDGMLDPDSFSNKFEQWKTKVSDERVVGHIGAWWETWNAGHEVWQKTNKNWTEDQRFVQVSLKSSNAEQSYLSPKDTTAGGYTVITDKAKDPEAIMRFLNFAITPNGTRLFAWGIPNLDNSNWNFKDGKWSFNEKTKQEIINATYDYKAHEPLGSNYLWLDHTGGVISDAPQTNIWIDQCFNDQAKWKKVMNDNLKNTIYDNSAMDQIGFLPDNPVTVIQQQVDDIVRSYWAKAILSKTDAEFDQNYAELKSKVQKAGVDKLEKYMTEQYKNNLNNWGKK